MKPFVAAVILAAAVHLPTPGSATVSAARSLTDALPSTAELYSDPGPGGVRVNFAASSQGGAAWNALERLACSRPH